jgi:hypothetical protein
VEPFPHSLSFFRRELLPLLIPPAQQLAVRRRKLFPPLHPTAQVLLPAGGERLPLPILVSEPPFLLGRQVSILLPGLRAGTLSALAVADLDRSFPPIV